jgi:hypothetical protein
VSILRNGWTWAAFLLVVMLWPRAEAPNELQGPLALCQTTQAATEAQKDGLMFQTILMSGEINRLAGEVNRANQWRAGAQRVIGQLELQCRVHKP